MRETMRPAGQMHKAEHLLVRGWHRGFVLHQQSNQRWTTKVISRFDIYTTSKFSKQYFWSNILLSLVVATPTYETGNALDRGESGRCRVHCINGNCVDGKCQCRSGYQGEFCNERELSILSNNSSSQFQHNPIDRLFKIAICREPCLNQGRCIGPDRCACIYGYTGRRCETDYRCDFHKFVFTKYFNA